MDNNDIIDFYKKADNDNKPEEPLKEQVETPEPVVSEAVVIPVPESNDPFDKFLFNLAEKLKTEKKITEQQQQQFNERVVQPTTNPEDPFAKFLESFAGLVKEDENINKEENIKEATIDFINKLKNDDFFDREAPKVIPKVKQAKSKSKKYLPPKFAKKVEKVEEEQPVIEQSTEPEPTQPEQTNNPYLKELQTADKKKNKIEDKISGLSDIKKIIAQQIQEQLSKYPNLGFTGGGGGTNAVQYAEGGTMRGDLNVTGKYLSGGVDISTLFGSGGGGGGYADRFVSGPSQFILDPDGKLHPLDNDLLTLQSENAGLSAFTRIVLSPYAFFAYDNEGNSITFDEVDNAIVLTSRDLHEWTFNSEGKLIGPSGTLAVSGNVDVTNKFLSGGVDLADIFLTQETDSQTLTFTESSANLSISNGNIVSLSSLQSNYIYTNISQNVLSNRKYAFDTSSTSLTATLPLSPQIGDEIEFFDITGYWFINNLVIANNGNYIEQKFETLECDVKFGSIQLIYVGPIDNIGWRIIPKPRHSVPSIISPIVSISSDISFGYDPILINFTGINTLDNITAPVDNWYWNLTGGNTPDYFTQNVSYNYSTPGVYTVNLTGSNAVGIGTASKTITALPMLVPVPTISSNLVGLSGYTPLTASFIGINTLPVSSSPVSNWYWNLTGGNIADYTTQTVTYVYQTSGNYTVNLSASNASGTGTTSINVAVSSVVAPTIPSGYLAFWKLDNTTDSSGNGNTLVNTNTTFGPGKIGNCAQFDGTGNTYLSLNSFSSTFNTASPYTVSLWYNITTLKNYFTLIGCSNTSTFNIHGSNSGQLDINNSAAADVQIASFFTTGSWNHLVVTRDSSNQIRVWKNGTKVYDALATASYGNVPFIDIGFLRTYSSSFATNGKIDAVGIWTRALNQTEIDQLYNGGNGAEP